MNISDVPTPKDGVMFRELEDGCVLYDAETEKVHSLNVTAGVIWCLMDGVRPLSEIADDLRARSDVATGTALSDVLRAADEFARQGLFQ